MVCFANKFNGLTCNYQPQWGLTHVPADSSANTGIAGRYATALFELARDQGSLDAVAQDLSDLAAMHDGSEDLQRMLRSPVIGNEAQARAIGRVLEQAGAGDLTKNFVGVMAANRRLFALRDVCRVFRALLAEHRGEIVAEVTSAQALKDPQVAAIKSELSAAMRTDVNLETKVDPELLGGMIVKVGSRMVDSSLRTKLQNLKFAMRGVE